MCFLKEPSYSTSFLPSLVVARRMRIARPSPPSIQLTDRWIEPAVENIRLRKVGEMYQILCEAIRAKAVLRLSLTSGESRIVEPYRYGARTNGQEFLNAYHRPEFGTQQVPQDVKTVALVEIASATPTGETFTFPKPGYKALGDRRIPQIFAEI